MIPIFAQASRITDIFKQQPDLYRVQRFDAEWGPVKSNVYHKKQPDFAAVSSICGTGRIENPSIFSVL
jgi:hypothetical protein